MVGGDFGNRVVGREDLPLEDHNDDVDKPLDGLGTELDARRAADLEEQAPDHVEVERANVERAREQKVDQGLAGQAADHVAQNLV